MLLAIDVGNTNITVGIFENKELKSSFRLTTKTPRTSDEYGYVLRELLLFRNIGLEQIDFVIIASVVPQVMHALTNSIQKYFNIVPFIVGAGTKTGIKVTSINPKEVGADRIVDLAGAYEIYGSPIIVVDFGTAITYDYITEDGTFAAGVTSPGLKIAAHALWDEAAKLPEVEIMKPDSILARDTVTSMQAGLVYGCIGQTEYIIRKIKEEAGVEECLVVATGGLGRIISDATNAIDIYDPELTLKGLMLIAEKNRKVR